MLHGVIAEAARRFGETPAFVAPGGTETSDTDLYRRAGSVAAGLVAQGVGDGDVVALRMASDISYTFAYLAATRIGAVTAGINPKLAVAEQDALVAGDEVPRGDVGEMCPRLRLAGRSKEVYVRGGYNVYPMEVEFP